MAGARKKKKKTMTTLGFTEAHEAEAIGPEDLVQPVIPAETVVEPMPVYRSVVSATPLPPAKRATVIQVPEKSKRQPYKKSPVPPPWEVFGEPVEAIAERKNYPIAFDEPGYEYESYEPMEPLPEPVYLEPEPEMTHIPDVVPMPLGLGGVRTVAVPHLTKRDEAEIARRERQLAIQEARQVRSAVEPVGKGLAAAPGAAATGVSILTGKEAGGMIIREEDDMSDLLDGLEPESWETSDITSVTPQDLIGGEDPSMNDVFAVPDEVVMGSDDLELKDILDIDEGAMPGEPDPLEVTDEDILGTTDPDMKDVFDVSDKDIGAEEDSMDSVLEVGSLDDNLDDLFKVSADDFMGRPERSSRRPVRKVPPQKTRGGPQLSRVGGISSF